MSFFSLFVFPRVVSTRMQKAKQRKRKEDNKPADFGNAELSEDPISSVSGSDGPPRAAGQSHSSSSSESGSDSSSSSNMTSKTAEEREEEKESGDDLELHWPTPVDEAEELAATVVDPDIVAPPIWDDEQIPIASAEELSYLQQAHARDDAQVSLARTLHRALHPSLAQFRMDVDSSSEEEGPIVPFDDLGSNAVNATASTEVPTGGPPEEVTRHHSGGSLSAVGPGGSTDISIPLPSDFGLPDF